MKIPDPYSYPERWAKFRMDEQFNYPHEVHIHGDVTFTTTKRIQHMNTKEFMYREKRINYMYTEMNMDIIRLSKNPKNPLT